MPWAWFLAWLLTGAGASIVYTGPLPLPAWRIGLYIGLSAAGWAAAGFITTRASNGKSSLVVQLAAWAAAYLVAIPLGLVWMLSRDLPPWFLFLPLGVAGLLGGLASSARPGVWRLVSGILVGLVFYLCSTLSFFAGYMLILFNGSLAQQNGVDIGLPYPLLLVLPQPVFGLLAGFLARWILGARRCGFIREDKKMQNPSD
jgi:hypothetical protein